MTAANTNAHVLSRVSSDCGDERWVPRRTGSKVAVQHVSLVANCFASCVWAAGVGTVARTRR